MEEKKTSRRGLIAAGLVGGVGVLMSPVKAMASAVTNQFMGPPIPGNQVVFSGAVIRFSDPDGWPSIHANGSHIAPGVTGVDINQHGELRVWQTIKDPGANPIVFAFAQADETLGGERGIILGASGGTDNTRFRVYDTRIGRKLDLNVRSDRMRIQGETSNIWVGFVHAPLSMRR